MKYKFGRSITATEVIARKYSNATKPNTMNLELKKLFLSEAFWKIFGLRLSLCSFKSGAALIVLCINQPPDTLTIK